MIQGRRLTASQAIKTLEAGGYLARRCTRRSMPECLLFGAPIEPDDAALLCVHFQPKSEHRE